MHPTREELLDIRAKMRTKAPTLDTDDDWVAFTERHINWTSDFVMAKCLSVGQDLEILHPDELYVQSALTRFQKHLPESHDFAQRYIDHVDVVLDQLEHISPADQWTQSREMLRHFPTHQLVSDNFIAHSLPGQRFMATHQITKEVIDVVVLPAEEANVFRVFSGHQGFLNVRTMVRAVNPGDSCWLGLRLGLSLDTLFKRCRSKFSLKTILSLADQLILRLQQLHFKFYFLSKIEPSTFSVACNLAWSPLIYLTGISLAKRFEPHNIINDSSVWTTKGKFPQVEGR
ncbi:MAG: Casein kinase I isoform delta [Icmadophila ericetorum]|nr:Casein kinase I isoform delta [Icmadophila ericetorum]